MHRLDPRWTPDVRSPYRHVRSRLYFTSESHIHSLVNTLRYSHLLGLPPGRVPPILREQVDGCVFPPDLHYAVGSALITQCD